jgi:hypothetical protein
MLTFSERRNRESSLPALPHELAIETMGGVPAYFHSTKIGLRWTACGSGNESGRVSRCRAPRTRAVILARLGAFNWKLEMEGKNEKALHTNHAFGKDFDSADRPSALSDIHQSFRLGGAAHHSFQQRAAKGDAGGGWLSGLECARAGRP